MNNVIPPITDPLGRHWDQPKLDQIVIDDTHAVMDAYAFAKLHEYSGSRPSGVYPGKMWKRHDGLFDRDCKVEDRRWLLMWFGEVEGRPDLCSNNHRVILIA
jgi:hypothetical protein